MINTFCSRFGEVDRIKVSKSHSKHVGSLCALANYKHLQDQSILSKEHKIGGRTVIISLRDLPPPELNKIFVGNLPITRMVKETELAHLFTRFGVIQRIVCIFNKNSNKCKGYAFVTFENIESVEEALGCQNLELDGVKLICDRPKIEGIFPSFDQNFSNKNDLGKPSEIESNQQIKGNMMLEKLNKSKNSQISLNKKNHNIH